MDTTFEYAMFYDTCTNDEYPYTGRDDACKADKCKTGIRVSAHDTVKHYSEVDLKASVYKHGPASIAVCASYMWQFYFFGTLKWGCG